MPVRRAQLVMVVAAALALVVLAGGTVASALTSAPPALVGLKLVSDMAPPTPPMTPTTAAAPRAPVTSTPAPSSPPRTTLPPGPATRKLPKQVSVVSDSVVLGASQALQQRLAGWQLSIQGAPSLRVGKAEATLRLAGQPVAPTVVVALGHNSLWERNRRNYGAWAAQFDRDADRLVATLRSLGAVRVVWVTVRELEASIVPGGWKSQLGRYGFHFPYVNERLAALAQRNPAVTLADWSSVAHQPGITIDAIHVNDVGARLLADLIADAVER